MLSVATRASVRCGPMSHHARPALRRPASRANRSIPAPLPDTTSPGRSNPKNAQNSGLTDPTRHPSAQLLTVPTV
jgi:hypothetical protein